MAVITTINPRISKTTESYRILQNPTLISHTPLTGWTPSLKKYNTGDAGPILYLKWMGNTGQCENCGDHVVM